MQLTWHVPNAEEIDFVLQIFREFVEPILNTLHDLLEPGECSRRTLDVLHVAYPY